MKIDWRRLRAAFSFRAPRPSPAPLETGEPEVAGRADGPPCSGELPPPTAAEGWSFARTAPEVEPPPSSTRRPPSLDAWETVVDRIIREAQERGEFDNLPGAGKPLRLDDNPFAGEWELGFHMLKQAGYTLPWIELGREIEAGRASLKALLERASRHLAEMRRSTATAAESARYAAERARYRDQYLEAAAELDRKLAQYSAEVPTWRMDQGRLPRDVAARQFDSACPPL